MCRMTPGTSPYVLSKRSLLVIIYCDVGFKNVIGSRKPQRIDDKKNLPELISDMAKFQDTRLIFESQILFYMPAKKERNLKLKTQHPFLTGVGRQLGGLCPTT